MRSRGWVRPTRLAALAIAVAGLVAGCAPLTFSNEAVIDFELYSSVFVAVGGLDGSERDARYLEAELRDTSGFSRVTRDPTESVDAVLDVELEIDIDRRVFSDEPDEYTGRVDYVLTSPDGEVLDSGRASSASSTSLRSAAEGALDEVVYRYLPSYRL